MAEKITKKRDSGVELLRIMAIMMVICIHAFNNGNYFEEAVNVGGVVKQFSTGIRIFIRPAVNIFVIITGYFMVKMKFDLKKAYKRVLRIYLVLLFYSIVLYVLTFLLGPKYYTIDGVTDSKLIMVLKMLMPVSAQTWYFLSHYIMLCLLAPFVNIILQNIKKEDYHVLLIVTTFLMSIWFMLSDIKLLDEVVRVKFFAGIQEGKSVFSFLYIYIIGGYIRLHTPRREKPNPKYLVYAFGCVLVNGLLTTVLEDTLELQDMILKYTNPIVILMTVWLLMFFKDLHFYSKIVNALASTTIGVYAIHEFKYVREALWNMFDFKKVDCSNMFLNLVYLISIVVMVFGLCAGIDLLRQKLFKIFDKQNRSGKAEKLSNN